MTTTKALTAASLTALFALTACTGGDRLVFDFTEYAMDSAPSIEFRIPDELIELSDDYAENRVYETVTVAAVESDDPSRCAVEYQFDYVDGGLDRLLGYVQETSSRSNGTTEERIAGLLTGEASDSVLTEDYSSAVVSTECAASPTDTENTVRVAFFRMLEDEAATLARVEIVVMQGSELFVHEPEVEDWQLDTNGNWISQGE
ncbi:hypothetical protein [Nocardiopsis synnemataformans]|uniref:hypothetical protein n=1 Tax=Nocardiopsis synnemataformans TaxID=61305 RepID=UPI003EBBB076